MGIRLGIYEVFYCNDIEEYKLYKYVDIEKCKSANWFVEHHYFADLIDIECLHAGTNIQMTIKDFREFAVLYNEDMNKYYPYRQAYKYEDDWWINQKGVQRLLKKKDYDTIILEWG